MGAQEPKLCPDCPLRQFLKDVKPTSYTRSPTDQTNVLACSKLRALAAKWGWPTCQYFPRLENLLIWEEMGNEKPSAKSKR